MKNMYTLSELSTLVNNYIKAQEYSRSPKGLYDPIEYSLSLGGKRVRPVLMLMAANLYCEEVDKFLPMASAIEFYHNFTLLHDDLMDKSERRRGMPTVYKKWNISTAVLSGDAMLILAYSYLQSVVSERKDEINKVFTQAALEVCEGQQLDMDYELRGEVVNEVDYIEMIRLKTSVLLAASLKIGSLLGGASEEDAQLLYDFGVQIGIAFQLKDDYLDVYGDPKVFGKNIGDDIVTNKETYLLIKALDIANEKQRMALSGWLNRDVYVNSEKITAVTALFNEIGVKEYCISKMNEYYDLGLQSLAKVDLPEERKVQLKDFAESLLNREV
jgi:geranylgeranyl diphosphate synthase type II